MPYSQLKVDRRFGGTYLLHHQDRRIWQARNQREADSKQSLVSEDTALRLFPLLKDIELFIREPE
jgi:hypothetical protein